MTRTLIAAAATALIAGATLATAAAADPALAIAQENASREGGDRIQVVQTFRRAPIGAASPSFELARSIVNGSADSQDGAILGRGVTVSGDGHSARAAAIFAQLAAADDTN